MKGPSRYWEPTSVKSTMRTEWFQFVENVGIYGTQIRCKKVCPIGENIAALYRVRNDSTEEPRAKRLGAGSGQHGSSHDCRSRKAGRRSVCILADENQIGPRAGVPPAILVLTEPTSELAPELFREFVELIRRTPS